MTFPFHMGIMDCKAGILPQSDHPDYWRGYIFNRPAGMDFLVSNFESAEDWISYLNRR